MGKTSLLDRNSWREYNLPVKRLMFFFEQRENRFWGVSAYAVGELLHPNPSANLADVRRSCCRDDSVPVPFCAGLQSVHLFLLEK